MNASEALTLALSALSIIGVLYEGWARRREASKSLDIQETTLAVNTYKGLVDTLAGQNNDLMKALKMQDELKRREIEQLRQELEDMRRQYERERRLRQEEREALMERIQRQEERIRALERERELLQEQIAAEQGQREGAHGQA